MHPECKNLWDCRSPAWRWQAVCHQIRDYLLSFSIKEIQCQCHYCTTSNLRLASTPDQDWKHLQNIQLADPDYAKPGKIDILLGVETLAEVIRHGQQSGSHNSPTALEMEFGWVLAGNTGNNARNRTVASHHMSVLTGDDMLRQFWEVEEKTVANSTLTLENAQSWIIFSQHILAPLRVDLLYHSPNGP